MTTESYVFYDSFYEAFCEIDDIKERLECYEVITRYALFGEIPENMSATAKITFKLIKPQIDANLKRREDGLKGAEYGKLGGAPKGNQNARKKNNGIGLNETTPLGLIETTLGGYENNPYGVNKTTPNVNANGNVNVNENANVNENGNVTVNAFPYSLNTSTNNSDVHSQVMAFARKNKLLGGE
ncbi:MAG: hypothetical protein KBT03_13850 [Bacteroidales bacterium]|nr:hypothetical protein [Candidatus Scybalousia scybalohippi]